MKHLVVTALAAIALSSGSALAADLAQPVYKAPTPPAVVPNWTGCYIDAGVGYGFYDENTQVVTTATGAPVGSQLDQAGRGWLGRVGGGCDYQFGSSWVIGAFADYDFADIHGSHTGQDGAIGLISGDEKLRDSWAAGGRIGYLVTPGLLSYVDGGYTEARLDAVNYVSGATGLPTGFGISSSTFHGWFLGGGAEYALVFSWLPIHGLFWRTEYRYTDYGSQSIPVIVTATGASHGFAEQTHLYDQTVTSGIVWRFNFGGPIATRY